MKYKGFLMFLKGLAKKILPRNIYAKVSAVINKDRIIRVYLENSQIEIDPKGENIEKFIPVFYWDKISNFGDVIGPYLLSKLTGKPAINIHNLKASGIMSVGSILNQLDRNKMVVWGSGLIEKPTDNIINNIKKFNPKILSVRGHETAKCLLENGVNVPDSSTYGDPALVLPFFYKPIVSNKKKIGVCPHYSHKSYFLSNAIKNDDIKVIDVQKDIESVVNSICSSHVCISTSLHGLIISQAYGIPWVWLEICDNNLIGGEFKFNDFFSTLEKSQVAHVRVKLEELNSLNFSLLAEKARLPEKKYDESLILDTLKEYLGVNYININPS